MSSYYGVKFIIDGVKSGISRRVPFENGKYSVVFEREYASLEQIEAINWANPVIEVADGGECVLPSGYGFEVLDISYDSTLKSYTVTLQVEKQYLGDVTGYQEQITNLNAEIAKKDKQIASQKDTIKTLEEIQAQAIQTIPETNEDPYAKPSEVTNNEESLKNTETNKL